MPTPLPLRHLLVAIALATLPALASAQTPAVTEADYARAERLISYAAQPLVDHAATRLHWLDATHVVYVDHDAKGNRLLQLDTSTGKTAPIFKQAALVASLNTLLKTGDKSLKADTFAPMVKLTADGRYRLNVRDTAVVCDARARCSKLYAKDKPEPGVLSPDKRSEAFIRDWNLWVRDLASGQETQLTRDGVENFATPPTTPAGSTPITPSWPGRRTPARSPPSNRTSARPATCTWSAPSWGIRNCSHGNIRWPATRM